MKRCVVRFKDGNHANLEADTLTQEDNTFVAYKRNNVEMTAQTGIAFELVGRFSAEDISSIYLSEKTENRR